MRQKTESSKRKIKRNKSSQTQTQYGGYRGELGGGEEVKRVKGVTHVLTERDDLGGEHTTRHTDDVF